VAGSTVPTVKALIITTLQARPGLAGVKVTYAQTGERAGTRVVFLGQVRAHHEYAAMAPGRKRRNETYSIDLFVQVNLPGKNIQQNEAQAFVLMKEVEDMLADDPRLGSSVLDSAGIGDWELDSGLGDKGAAVQIRMQIDCSAQLA